MPCHFGSSIYVFFNANDVMRACANKCIYAPKIGAWAIGIGMVCRYRHPKNFRIFSVKDAWCFFVREVGCLRIYRTDCSCRVVV